MLHRPFSRAFMWLTDLVLGDATQDHSPRWLRRTYVLTFPISLPLAVVLTVVFAALGMIEAVAYGIAHALKEVWK